MTTPPDTALVRKCERAEAEIDRLRSLITHAISILDLRPKDRDAKERIANEVKEMLAYGIRRRAAQVPAPVQEEMRLC